MRTPILKQGKYLIASLQGALSDADLLQLREELVTEVRRYRSLGVVLDVSLLDVVDSFAARTLRGIAHVTKLLGAEAVLVGIQPEVAFSMVQLGLTLTGVATALDLEEGLALLRRLELGTAQDSAGPAGSTS
jgi:rsbT antagonist protein RsbS